MTSPFALAVSIAGTVFGFIIAIVGIIADAAITPTTADSATMPPGIISAVDRDFNHGNSVAYTVALEPAASRR
jgi:hypothetical protein